MRDEAQAWMDQKGLQPADLAALTGISASSISRLLKPGPAAETPSLQKLHKYISGAGGGELGPALEAIDRMAKRTTARDAAGAAEILRVVADLLERIERAR